ncbi:hypothetical protein [Streptomyces kanamyceticus]|uniref:Uncharacterized protein n=1 Tax=Streptomyces kanamyceticus TaxID=1967 RepID=A0A5J6GEB2_STRKN|nr:hypothetical protein [Streptomyces kanamyceticus]QEU92338.1 hypothetical protein CP970_16775 [Streptomyces kanamyceticus]
MTAGEHGTGHGPLSAPVHLSGSLGNVSVVHGDLHTAAFDGRAPVRLLAGAGQSADSAPIRASADELPQHSIAVPDQASDAVQDVKGDLPDVKKAATGAAAKVKSVDTAPTVDADQVRDKLPAQDKPATPVGDARALVGNAVTGVRGATGDITPGPPHTA